MKFFRLIMKLIIKKCDCYIKKEVYVNDVGHLRRGAILMERINDGKLFCYFTPLPYT